MLFPPITIPWVGRRSMMMLKVSHKFARENQVKKS